MADRKNDDQPIPINHDAMPISADTLSLHLSSIQGVKKAWGKARVNEFDTPFSKRHKYSSQILGPSLKVQAWLSGMKQVYTTKNPRKHSKKDNLHSNDRRLELLGWG